MLESTVARAKLLGTAPSFTVPDIMAAVEFYCGTLGFQSDSADEWFAILSRDGFSIMFWPGESTPNGYWDACFWVDNVDALYQEFQTQGVTIMRAPETMHYGLREMSIMDNNGYTLTFAQRVA